MAQTNLSKFSPLFAVILTVIFLAGCGQAKRDSSYESTTQNPPVQQEEQGTREINDHAIEEGVSSTEMQHTEVTPSGDTSSTSMKTPVTPTSQNSGVKTFAVTGKNFVFTINGQDNPDIKVKEGDKVRIEFVSADGFHDWKVDEFNAATARVQTGGTSSVEFVANKKGTFEYYCSVGQHRQHGMKGKLIVE